MSSHSMINIDMLTKDALLEFHNSLTFIKHIRRQYSDEFAKTGAKIGTTLRIRKPVQLTVRTGATASLQDITENKEDLTVATQKGVDWDFTTVEQTMETDQIFKRYIKPGVQRLASQLDFEALSMYKDVFNVVGTPGTVPATILPWLQGVKSITEMGGPIEQLQAFINPATNAAMVDGLKGIYNAQGTVGKQNDKGYLTENFGLKWYLDQNINVHTVGAHGGTPLVDGASQTGATLVTNGWTFSTAVLKKGDTFTLADVYSVNRETKQSTGSLQRFVATADGTSGADPGALSVAISPPITTSGAYQTVNASPANDAAITVLGTLSTNYAQNMICHPDAFTFVSADMYVPDGVGMASRQVYDGISMRLLKDYDAVNDKDIFRIDVLYGYLTTDPNLACRVTA